MTRKQRGKCDKKSEDDTAEPGGSLEFGDSNDEHGLDDQDCDFRAEPLHETKCHGSRRGGKEDGPKLELERRRSFLGGHAFIVAARLDQGQGSSSILKPTQRGFRIACRRLTAKRLGTAATLHGVSPPRRP